MNAPGAQQGAITSNSAALPQLNVMQWPGPYRYLHIGTGGYAKRRESPNEPPTRPEVIKCPGTRGNKTAGQRLAESGSLNNTVVAQARLPFTLPPAVGATLLPPLLTNAGSSQAPLHITAPTSRGHTAAASPLDQHDSEDDDNEQRAAASDGDTDDGASGEHR